MVPREHDPKNMLGLWPDGAGPGLPTGNRAQTIVLAALARLIGS
jgi:hypothetical protein